MGCGYSEGINVATLNYSGLNLSPFQFYSGNEELDRILNQLNIIFKRLVVQQYNKQLSSIKWLIGEIDLKMQDTRYSPIYSNEVGLKDNRLMTRQQFLERWREVYNANKRNITFKNEPTPQETKMCSIFDYLLYLTFVTFCKENLQKHPNYQPNNDRETTQYQIFMNRFFKNQHSLENRKKPIVHKLCNSHNFIFLQDTTLPIQQHLQQLNQFTIVKQQQSKCMIVINPKRASRIYTKNNIKQYLDSIQKNQALQKLFHPSNFEYYNTKPSAYCIVDQYLLINVHLSSCSHRYVEQFQKFIQHMIKIKTIIQSQKLDLHFIIGGDFNQDIQQYYRNGSQLEQQVQQILPQFKSFFKICPLQKEIFTSRKKRTALQAQAHKCDKQVQICRDYIITDLQIQHQCLYIKQLQKVKPTFTQQMCLPLDSHPFDHLILSAELTNLK